MYDFYKIVKNNVYGPLSLRAHHINYYHVNCNCQKSSMLTYCLNRWSCNNGKNGVLIIMCSMTHVVIEIPVMPKLQSQHNVYMGRLIITMNIYFESRNMC